MQIQISQPGTVVRQLVIAFPADAGPHERERRMGTDQCGHTHRVAGKGSAKRRLSIPHIRLATEKETAVLHLPSTGAVRYADGHWSSRLRYTARERREGTSYVIALAPGVESEVWGHVNNKEIQKSKKTFFGSGWVGQMSNRKKRRS